MLQALRNSEVQFVAIFLGCVLLVLVLGLWYVAKTTGRPLRDMLGVLAAAITLVLLLMPLVKFLSPGWDSPDSTKRFLGICGIGSAAF